MKLFFLRCLVLFLYMGGPKVLAQAENQNEYLSENKNLRFFCHNLFAKKMDTRMDLVNFQAWLRDRFRRYPSTTSMRYDQASALTGIPENVGTEVIYFGSGPDIYTPLMNFPLAENIHLVDLFSSGWGLGSGHVLGEIILRLKAVHPEVSVILEDKGFLINTPSSFQNFISEILTKKYTVSKIKKTSLAKFNLIKFPYENSEWLDSTRASHPIVFKIEWPAENYQVQKRRIFVHFMDFNDQNDLNELNHFIDKRDLAGVIVMGISFPKELEFYLNRLPKNALAILETWSDVSKQDLNLFERLDESQNFDIQVVRQQIYLRYQEVEPINNQLRVLKRK